MDEKSTRSVGSAGAESAAESGVGGGGPVLRAKYRDYCSARVADVLMGLSPDEIYTLAQEEAEGMNRSSPSSYGEAVALTTHRVRARLDLPSFEEWVVAYKKDPDAINPYLLGLWESDEAGED